MLDVTKKAHEKRVLDDALAFCKKCGGTKGRNAKKLSGLVAADGERPDLTIEINEDTAIGLEHFRVDHHIRGDKKAQTKSIVLSKGIESERRRIIGIEDEDARLEAAASALSEAAAEHLYNTWSASYLGLVRSFEKRIESDVTGHLPKNAEYREALRMHYPNAKRLELGFLIEVHADFRGLFLHEGTFVHELEAGECPLFSDVYDILLNSAEQFDWIVLAFYPPIVAEIEDAAVIDCRNGLFKTSAERQGLRRTALLNSADSSVHRELTRAKPEIAFEGDEVVISVDAGIKRIDGLELLRAGIDDVTAAFRCDRERAAYAMSLPGELVYEILQPEAGRSRRDFGIFEIGNMVSSLSKDERVARMERFSKRWGLSKA